MKYGEGMDTSKPCVDARITTQDMLLDIQRLENRLRGTNLAEPLSEMKAAVTKFSRQAADALIAERRWEKENDSSK